MSLDDLKQFSREVKEMVSDMFANAHAKTCADSIDAQKHATFQRD